MKKSLLKQKLLQATIASDLNMQMFEVIVSELKDTYEALERRRILYDRLVNHSTTKSPKSMKEMAESLYLVHSWMSEATFIAFKDLPQDIQDRWMDRLLTILN